MTLPVDDPRHGTYNAYRNHACRCAECKAGNAAQMRDYRQRNHERLNETRRNLYRARTQASRIV